MHKITITVSGESMTGKSTIIALLISCLKALGIDADVTMAQDILSHRFVSGQPGRLADLVKRASGPDPKLSIAIAEVGVPRQPKTRAEGPTGEQALRIVERFSSWLERMAKKASAETLASMGEARAKLGDGWSSQEGETLKRINFGPPATPEEMEARAREQDGHPVNYAEELLKALEKQKQADGRLRAFAWESAAMAKGHQLGVISAAWRFIKGEVMEGR